MTNNLFGVQFGCLMNYAVTQRFGVFVIPKAGVFANQMNGLTQLYSGNGIFGTVNNGNGPQTLNISAHKCDVAFLGELDAGFNYAITPNIIAFMGYRVVGVANVALSDNQFLPYMADLGGFAQIKQNGGLILHGAFSGVAWAF